MAKYKQLEFGSTGDEVTALQKQLNQAGNYNLAEDGIFGQETSKAVKDYQLKNKLSVDGIAGELTLGSLFKGQDILPSNASQNTGATTGATSATPAMTEFPKFEYEDYKDPEVVTQAYDMIQQHMATSPGKWSGGTWLDTLNDTINKINNREEFSYDLNGDALYQQYKDKFVQQGKMASQDVMGQAAAITGGYGNSYAQGVGQQAYQQSLQNLNDVVPELYQMAYDQYKQEGQDLYDQAALLGQMEDREYGMYRDEVSDYYAELERLTEDARYKDESSYGRWSDKTAMDYNIFADKAEMDYQIGRDAVADQQYREQMDLTKEQWAWEQAQAAAGGGSSGGNGGNGGGGDEPVSDFKKAVFSRVDDNGNYVFYIDGKERTYAPGVNPYTGTKNKDVEHGTFDNGYQPNNIGGKKLTKSGITDVVNGVTQNVWQTSDGKLWIWDGTKNRYLEYDDGREPTKSASTAGMGSNKNMFHTLN